jgi:hypothetical protein
VAEAYAIKWQTGSKLWTNTVAKEMLNMHPGFKFMDDEIIPAFWKPVGVYMIFNVKWI